MSFPRSIKLLVAAALAAAACQRNQSQALSDSVRNQVSQEIRDAVIGWTSAVNRLDPAPFLEQASAIQSYAENTTVYPDADSLASAVRTVMGSLRSARMDWVGDPVVLVLGPNEGVFTSRWRQTITDSAGVTSTLDGTWTGVYRRIDGSWKIVTAHESYAPAAAGEGL